MKAQTKVIIRGLPRSLTKEQFLNAIHPFTKFNYFRFCSADKSNKVSSFARVYIDFINEDDMYDFKNEVENKLFVDDEGNESYGIIEFAVYQKIPGKNKVDSKQNSMATDPDYIKFLQEVNEAQKNSNIGTVESNLEEIKNKESEKLHATTPLIDFINSLPKKERCRKDDYRRKADFMKSFAKKDINGVTDPKVANKMEIKSIKKNILKESIAEVAPKIEAKKVVDKIDPKKPKTHRRSDIKTYAANYKEYGNEYDPYLDERSPKRGFENSKMYREGRQYEGGADYYGGGVRASDLGGYYRGHGDGHYGHPRGGRQPRGGARPPAYSATRKD